MTITQFQAYVHSLYQADGSTPSSGSDEWNHRLNLGIASIGLWDTEPVFWNELWSTLTDAADGDKTVLTSDVDYDMPTDFRFLGSFVRTTSSAGDHTYWQVVTPQKAEEYKNSSVKACYVTGNKSAGFVLHFLQQPPVGDTINYPYYKEPATPTTGSDVLEMSDPWFAVYYSLGKLHESDGDGSRASVAYSQAEQKLKNMKLRNVLLPNGQPNGPSDMSDGFGVTGGWGISRYGQQL